MSAPFKRLNRVFIFFSLFSISQAILYSNNLYWEEYEAFVFLKRRERFGGTGNGSAVTAELITFSAGVLCFFHFPGD